MLDPVAIDAGEKNAITYLKPYFVISPMVSGESESYLDSKEVIY
jgi:hypothetical protein